MTAQRVDGVLLTGDAIRVAYLGIMKAQESRRRDGLPPSRAFATLANLLSPSGHADTDSDPAGQAERNGMGPGSGGWMSTQEAANLLGCSPRTVRRKAKELGGRKTAGVLTLDPIAVHEHLEGAR